MDDDLIKVDKVEAAKEMFTSIMVKVNMGQWVGGWFDFRQRVNNWVIASSKDN